MPHLPIAFGKSLGGVWVGPDRRAGRFPQRHPQRLDGPPGGRPRPSGGRRQGGASLMGGGESRRNDDTTKWGKGGQIWVPWRGTFEKSGFHGVENRHNLGSMAWKTVGPPSEGRRERGQIPNLKGTPHAKRFLRFPPAFLARGRTSDEGRWTGDKSMNILDFWDLTPGISCFFHRRLPSGACQAEGIIPGLTRAFPLSLRLPRWRRHKFAIQLQIYACPFSRPLPCWLPS